jgi:ABC-type amino acid transport system permease subunit
MGLTDYDWGLIWDNRDALLSGLWVALKVSAIALVISVVGGLLLAVLRMSRPPVSW